MDRSRITYNFGKACFPPMGFVGELEVAPELKPWMQISWYCNYVDRLVSPFVSPGPRPGDAVTVTDSEMAHHCIIVGTPGAGKSYLARHLLRQQFATGCSVMAIDSKWKSVGPIVQAARDAGLSPKQIAVVDLSGDMVAGWNPLLINADPASTAQTLAEIVAGATDITARSRINLQNALVILIAHRLSLHELDAFLGDQEYREAIMDAHCSSSTTHVYRKASKHFRTNYFPKGADAPTVSSMSARLQSVTDHPKLEATLCAHRNTVDLDMLWKEQMTVVVVASSGVGDGNAAMVGALFSHQMKIAAMRASGPVTIPVVLALDEMGVNNKYIGKAITEIADLAREAGLRLLVACQRLGQLEGGLGDALQGASVRAYMRVGADDARSVSRDLCQAWRWANPGKEVAQGVSVQLSTWRPVVMPAYAYTGTRSDSLTQGYWLEPNLLDHSGCTPSVPPKKFVRVVDEELSKPRPSRGILAKWYRYLSAIPEKDTKLASAIFEEQWEDWWSGTPQLVKEGGIEKKLRRREELAAGILGLRVPFYVNLRDLPREFGVDEQNPYRESVGYSLSLPKTACASHGPWHISHRLPFVAVSTKSPDVFLPSKADTWEMKIKEGLPQRHAVLHVQGRMPVVVEIPAAKYPEPERPTDGAFLSPSEEAAIIPRRDAEIERVKAAHARIKAGIVDHEAEEYEAATSIWYLALSYPSEIFAYAYECSTTNTVPLDAPSTDEFRNALTDMRELAGRYGMATFASSFALARSWQGRGLTCPLARSAHMDERKARASSVTLAGVPRPERKTLADE